MLKALRTYIYLYVAPDHYSLLYKGLRIGLCITENYLPVIKNVRKSVRVRYMTELPAAMYICGCTIACAYICTCGKAINNGSPAQPAPDPFRNFPFSLGCSNHLEMALQEGGQFLNQHPQEPNKPNCKIVGRDDHSHQSSFNSLPELERGSHGTVNLMHLTTPMSWN